MLTGPLARRAADAIAEVAAVLEDVNSGADWLPCYGTRSWSNRLAELALLFAYLRAAGLGDANGAHARRFLDEAVEIVSQEELGPWLYDGFAGVGFLRAHLAGAPASSEDSELFEEVDDCLGRVLELSPWPGHFELVNGLVGLGVYFLERLPAPAAVQGLERVLLHLEQAAEIVPGGLAWLTRPEFIPEERAEGLPNRAVASRGYYAMGVAHGVSGIVGFLNELWRAHIARERVRRLLEGTIGWLLTQGTLPIAGRRFPRVVGPGVKPESFFGWCWGDIGIAASLVHAGVALDEPAWRDVGIAIALDVATAPLPPTADASLCHGAASHAHLLNRIFQATGLPLFRNAATSWYERTLACRREGFGIAGFATWAPRVVSTGWIPDLTLLTGAIGTALALLAATTSIEPKWDRLMLMSLPVCLSSRRDMP